MKVALALASIAILQACAEQGGHIRSAKQCVLEQLGDQKTITEPERRLVARRCDEPIRQWAAISTKRAYGSAFDLRNPQVRAEYIARKQAVIRVLMPLAGDPDRS